MDKVIAQDEKKMVEAERQKMEAAEETPEAQKTEEEETRWRWGSHEAEIVSVQILDGAGREQRTFQTGTTLQVRIHYMAHESIQNPKFGLALYHSSGFQISGPNSAVGNCPIPKIDGPGFVDYVIEDLPLLPGTYLITAAIHDLAGVHTYDHIHQRFTFRVRSDGTGEAFGSFRIPARWQWHPGQSTETEI
jgi:hypothetical protein